MPLMRNVKTYILQLSSFPHQNDKYNCTAQNSVGCRKLWSL